MLITLPETTAMPHTLNRRLVMRHALAGGLSLALPVARACQIPMGSFTIVHPWAYGTPAGGDGEVYMGFIEVFKADRLIGASSAVAERVEMGGVANPRVDFEIREGMSSGLSETGAHPLWPAQKLWLQEMCRYHQAQPLVLLGHR